MSIKNNTTSLQEILEVINALPEAGSGDPVLQNKTVTPTKSEQTVTADSEYDGLDTITVNAIPNEYITTDDATAVASDLLSGKTAYVDGEKITGTIVTKTSSDLTASGAAVTVPSGYYASQATKSVATATRAETTMSVTADDTNDKLTITASNNQSTGYVTGANKTATKTISLTASGATITASDGTKSVSKSVATATQATPSISIDSSGLITASATQPAGYVSAGTKSGTKQLTTQAAKTITPSKSSQTAVASGVYTTGAITVAAIPSQYITTTDATAEASEIMSGETAYVNGSKVTGTFSIDSELSTQDDLISQIKAKANSLPNSSGGEQATPTISINSSTGLITATAGTKSATKQLAFQPAKTITPNTTSQIAISSGYYTGGDITVAGDSNLVAGNIKSGVSIFGVSGTLEEGNSSGELVDYSENEDAMITGVISSYTNDRVTKIRNYAFYNSPNLMAVNFPAVTSIGSSAFYRCPELTTINFPVATDIGSCAFQECWELQTADFPAVVVIHDSAFCQCTYNLTTVNFPKARTIGTYAFSGCIYLSTVSFPAAINIGPYAFRGCHQLRTISFPIAQIIDVGAFSECRLSELYLGAFSVCALKNTNAFTSTSYLQRIYVPFPLLNDYKSATNWVQFSNYFVVIPGTENDVYSSFTLIGTWGDEYSYSFKNGMTWEEFINSNYTTDFYIINEKLCFNDGEDSPVYYNSEYVKVSDVIIPNAIYNT